MEREGQNMKRWIAILLTLVLAMSLAACGGASSKPEDKKPSQSTDAGTQTGPNKPAEPAKPAEPDEPSGGVYVLKDCTLVDNDQITVTVTGVEEKSGQINFELYLENKTELSLMYSLDRVLVNGYLNDPYWAKVVAAGKKANDAFSFDKNTLNGVGLLPIDELRFTLRVYDSEDWAADNLLDEEFTVYPTGKTAETVTHPDRVKTDGEQVVVDNDKGTFVILSHDPYGFWGYTVRVFVENKTDSFAMFSWDDVSVNGLMVDPYWAVGIPAHSAAYTDISFSTADFEDNDIDKVEEIEFNLRMYDSEDWSADDYANETFTYKP